MADHNDDSSPENIVAIDAGAWLERRELADRLGISGKRLERTIASDHVESKTTSEGLRYRYVGPPAEPEPPDSTSSPAGEPVDDNEVVSVEIEDWAQARESLARLETRLESSREDVRRAVDYAHQLEEECDRISDVAESRRDRIDEIRAELDEERGRCLELQEQYRAVVEQLEEMNRIRARYHLERNRRQEAEERLEETSEEIRQLQQKLEALAEALEEARQQGFTAELGGLTVEWRSGD